jgi:hypothetical protein
MKLLLLILLFCFTMLNKPASQPPDLTPPERAEITYVTVDTATNNIHIYWTQSPSQDVEKYRLYYETALGGIVFDSVAANEKQLYS